MGAYSTIELGRDAVQKALLGSILTASNSELEEMADTFLRDRLYNCTVRDGVGEDDYLIREGLK